MAHKIKGLFLSKGYSIRQFIKENKKTDDFYNEYQAFLRKVRDPKKFTVEDIELIGEKLNLHPEEVFEFFLPDLFQLLKRQ